MRLRNILNPHMKEQLFLNSKLQCQKLVDKNGTWYRFYYINNKCKTFTGRYLRGIIERNSAICYYIRGEILN